jgi:hypothetical protein
MTSLEKALREFAQFTPKLRGDEKSEAQTFLFHLLAAFGHDPNTRLAGLGAKGKAISRMMKLRTAPFMLAASMP